MSQSKGRADGPERREPAPPPAVVAARELRESIDALHGTVITARELLDQRLATPRPVDVSPARKPVAGVSGLLLVLRLAPALADAWAKRVPESHLEDAGGVVRCSCGERVELGGVAEIVDCPGAGCDRHFLRTEAGARVARWADEEVEDRYAGPGWTPAPDAA